MYILKITKNAKNFSRKEKVFFYDLITLDLHYIVEIGKNSIEFSLCSRKGTLRIKEMIEKRNYSNLKIELSEEYDF